MSVFWTEPVFSLTPFPGVHPGICRLWDRAKHVRRPTALVRICHEGLKSEHAQAPRCDGLGARWMLRHCADPWKRREPAGGVWKAVKHHDLDTWTLEILFKMYWLLAHLAHALLVLSHIKKYFCRCHLVRSMSNFEYFKLNYPQQMMKFAFVCLLVCLFLRTFSKLSSFKANLVQFSSHIRNKSKSRVKLKVVILTL